MNKINNLTKWLIFVLAINVTLIVWLFLVDSTDDKTLLWARYTARISFFFFTVSFVASSIHYFLSNSLTSFILNNRGYLGLSFALAHTIHLVALTSYFVTTNQNPDIVTVLGGGLAYLAMYIMAFTSNDNAVRKIGFNRHNQYVSQLNLGSIGNPANIWVPATQLIEPQILDIVEVAYERKLGKEFAGSINGYFKRLQNLNLVNNLSDASDPSIDWQSSVTQGVGQVFGAEVMLQRTKGMFNGWMSYTYSKSTRNFESLFASDFDFTYDRPHMFKMHVNYTNEDAFWNFGVNIVVGSGQLFTLPIGKFLDSNDEIQLQYNTLNNYRSPLYTRLDLSLVRLKSNFGLDQEWRFYLYNALGSRNPLNIAANFEGNSNFNVLQVDRAYLAYIPGVAYIVKF